MWVPHGIAARASVSDAIRPCVWLTDREPRVPTTSTQTAKTPSLTTRSRALRHTRRSSERGYAESDSTISCTCSARWRSASWTRTPCRRTCVTPTTRRHSATCTISRVRSMRGYFRRRSSRAACRRFRDMLGTDGATAEGADTAFSLQTKYPGRDSNPHGHEGQWLLRLGPTPDFGSRARFHVRSDAQRSLGYADFGTRFGTRNRRKGHSSKGITRTPPPESVRASRSARR